MTKRTRRNHSPAYIIFHDSQPAIRPNFFTEETPTLAKMQWANQTVFYENSIVLIDVYFPAHIFDIHPLARLPVILNFSDHSRALKPTQILRSKPNMSPGWGLTDSSRFEKLERAKGFEPSTPTLARLCSTPELRPLDGGPEHEASGRMAGA